jgi:hypothetical protein
MQIEKLSIDSAALDPSERSRLLVSLHGIGGEDFVACCDESLLEQIVLAAGQEFCEKVFRPEE